MGCCGGTPNGVGGVHSGARHPRSGPPAVGPCAPAQSMLHAASWGKIPPGQTGTLGSGRDHQAVDQLSCEATAPVEHVPLSPPSGHSSSSNHAMPTACQVILQTTLLNRDATACYMSALTLAVLWSIHLTPDPQLGLLAPLFRQLEAGLKFCLCGVWCGQCFWGPAPSRIASMICMSSLFTGCGFLLSGGNGSSAEWKRRG